MRPFDPRSDLAAGGYVVIRGLADAEMCTRVRRLYLEEVKPFDGRLLRQGTVRPERHNFCSDGYVTNPLLDAHRDAEPAIAGFSAALLDLITSRRLHLSLERLLGEEPVLVQSMAFESSRGNAPHADCDFLDATHRGHMLGVWIALEDIVEEAGRFFVYPRSHTLCDPAEWPPEVVESFERYESAAQGIIRAYREASKASSLKAVMRGRQLFDELVDRAGLRCFAPELHAGDAVFWTSRIFHGSDRPRRGAPSRQSITAHFVPVSGQLLRYGAVSEPIRAVRIGEMLVHLPLGRAPMPSEWRTDP